MDKLIVIILLVYCDNVFGEDIDDQDQRSTDSRVIGNFPNKYGLNCLSNRRQKYQGIWIRADKNGRGGYENYDNIYGQNGDNDINENDRYVGQNEGYNNNNRYVQGIRIGVNGYGDQDNQEDLVRPCQMEDYQCIRKLFAESSQCNPSYGPSPDPLYLDQNTMHMPYINLTYTLTNVKVTGMASAKIIDLYINSCTGNVVLSIQIKNLNITSPKAYLSYKRMGKEPIILADASSIQFSSLTLTVVIPRIPNLRLDLADIHAYVDDSTPEYKLGPAAYTSKDPDVTAAFLQLSTNIRLAISESFLLQAQLFAALFIQLNLYLGGDSKYSNKYNDGVDNYKGYDDNGDDDGDKYNSYTSYNDRDSKKDDNRYRDVNIVGLGKDDREDIVRPCALDDWQCIRKFFADNSNCKPVYGPVPDPLYLERNTVYYPFVNVSMVLTRLRVKGLASARISEFYVNKDTGNLVFAIDFKDLNETSPKAYYRFKRTAKESIVLIDFVTVLFMVGVVNFTGSDDEGDNKRDFRRRDSVDNFQRYENTEEKNEENQRYFNNDRNYKDSYYDINIIGIVKSGSEDVIYPCVLDDWQCIRKFFADNSKCTPSFGPISDPLRLERITQYYPSSNLTAIQTKFTVTGLANSMVTEFYVNNDTGNLVFAINFKDLNETSPKAYFRYKRKAKESIVLEDYTSVLYSSGTFTAVISKVPHLRLDLAEVHADIDNAAPPFYIGPAAYNSTDPDVIGAFAAFSSDIPTAIQEAFLFKSQLYIAVYIQEYICDFGLKIVSV
ncbi:Fibroin P25 [Operophtera brumata]|uniref:Fibroin P25 n=1 Tax=Operophtera brumata TaxID=104452 RepID=A0A0L7L2A8_OPEBR|nr:Fibroin P25 [Operophtera brumata]